MPAYLRYSHSTRKNYILIHALRDHEIKQRTTLESWLNEVANEVAKGSGESHRALVFKFRMSEVMDRSISDIRNAMASFRRKVFRIYSESADACQPETHEEGQTAPAVQDLAFQPLFIFVAHGLGAWWVKAALAHGANEQVAKSTLGLVFLDLQPLVPAGATVGDYDQVITRIRRTFSNKLAGRSKTPPNKLALASELQRIDDEFLKRRDKFPKDPHGRCLEPLFANIWVSSKPEQTGDNLVSPYPHINVSAAAYLTVSIQDRGLIDLNPPEMRLRLGRWLSRRRQSLPLEPINPEFANKIHEALGRSVEFRPTSLPAKGAGEGPAPPESSELPADMQSVDSDQRRALNSDMSPAFPNFSGQPKEPKKWEIAAKEGRSYLARSQLRNASACYKNALDTLHRLEGSMEPGEETRPDVINVKIGAAVAELCQGELIPAERRLRELSKKCKKKSTGVSPDMVNEVQRWHAVSVIHKGEYGKAMALLEELVDSAPGALPTDKFSFRVKRDLAVVYGLLGTLDKAADTLRSLKQYQRDADSKSAAQRPRSVGSISSLKLFVETEGIGMDMGAQKLEYAAGFVNLLRGSYRKALENVTLAWEGFREQLGPRHFETFKSARLRVVLLALVGSTDDAQKECKQLLPLLTEELGQKHPFTIETALTMVYILRTQRRLMEAVNTAQKLSKMAGYALPERHPLMLKLEAELAHCHRSAGDYETAKSILVNIVERPQEGAGVGFETLQMLRIETDLAYTYCLSGALEEAECCVMAVLKKQWYLFAPGRGPYIEGAETDHREADERLLSEILETLEQAFPSGKSREAASGDSPTPALVNVSKATGDGLEAEPPPTPTHQTVSEQRRQYSVLWVHPVMLYALRVAASVKSQLDGANSCLIRRVLNLVWKWQRRDDVLGSGHPVSLMTEFDYAVVLRDFGKDKDAVELFGHVFVTRKRVLGTSHPDTLTAKREFIATMCSAGAWTDPDGYTPLQVELMAAANDQGVEEKATTSSRREPSPFEGTDSEMKSQEPDMGIEAWDNAELLSREIFQLHQDRLGRDHPETIKSLVWVFTIQLLLEKLECADDTWKILLSRLRSPSTVRERLLDAMQNQEKIARLYLELSHVEKGLGILREMMDFLSQTKLDGPNPMLDDLSARVERLLSDYKTQSDGTRPEATAAVDGNPAVGNADPAGNDGTVSHPSPVSLLFPRLQTPYSG